MALTAALFGGWNALAIALFVLLAMLLNSWLPIYLERIDEASDREIGATLLSVDSQANSVFVMLVAPVLGWAVDAWGLSPVGGVGVVTAAIVLVMMARSSSGETE